MKSSNKHRFLVIGLGSMGKRRIRNLIRNGVPKSNIFGFNPTEPRCREVAKLFSIEATNNFSEAVNNFKPTVFMICAPPDKHSKYILNAIKHDIHFFVEHPTTDKGYKEIRSSRKKIVMAPSSTLRYHPAVKKIKELIASKKIGNVLSFQYHMGQYLPDWHPWEDYRDVYFSKKSTSACREMFAFELGWLCNMLDVTPKMVMGHIDKLSDLSMSADDIYTSIIHFNDKIIGTMVIDVLSRKYFRTLRVIGTKGVLQWEYLDNEVKYFNVKINKWSTVKIKAGNRERYYVNAEDMYEEEVRTFLDCIKKNKRFPFTFNENHHYLNTLFAMEKSNKTGKLVRISNKR